MGVLKRFVIVLGVMSILVIIHAYVFADGVESIPRLMMITGGLGLALSIVRHMPKFSSVGTNPMNRSVHHTINNNLNHEVQISSGFSKFLSTVGLIGFLFLVVGFYLS